MNNTQKLVGAYAIIIIITGAYLLAVEGVADGSFSLDKGGRDHKFSFFDVTLFLVFVLAAGLTIISTMAYHKKNSGRLLFVSGAFFLFTIMAALRIIDNFVLGAYTYIGISISTLEFLILLSLFYALFRK